MKKILLLLLLIVWGIFKMQSQSLIQFNFDNMADTSVFNLNWFPTKFFFNDDFWGGIIFDPVKQAKGSKSFLNISGTVKVDTPSNLYLFSLQIDTFNSDEFTYADWNIYKVNPYITFMANTNDGDSISLNIIWRIREFNWSSSNVLTFSTNGKWKIFQINLKDIEWYTNSSLHERPPINRFPTYIELNFYTSSYSNAEKINFNIDNIGITSSPLPLINGGYDQSAVCDMEKQISVATKIPDDTSIHYSWTPAEGLSVTNISNPVVQIKSDQKYYLTTTLPDNSMLIDSVYIKVLPLTVDIRTNQIACKRDTQLNVITNYPDTADLIYKWSPSAGLSATDISNPFLNLLSPNEYYKVEVETPNGCMASDSTLINFLPNYFREEICLVTVDTQINKNTIVWEKTRGKFIKEYEIYKESTIADSFVLIGTVPFNDLSIFVDTTSDPSQHADRYYMVTVDSCENRSVNSAIHQTIHLSITPGLSGKYILTWSDFYGFPFGTYYIYKGNSPGTLQLIDSVASSILQYSDTAAGIAYYQIVVRKANPCLPSQLKKNNDPYSQSVSNLEDNRLRQPGITHVDINGFLSIFPNPYGNELNIEYSLSNSSYIKINLFNTLGEQLYEYKQKNANTFKHSIILNKLKGTSQVYFIRFEINGKFVFRKLVKL